MNRLALDINVLVSSFPGTGPPRRVLNRVRDGQDLLCLSPAILGEYVAVLRRGGVPDASLRSLLELFRDPERVLLVAPTVRVTIIRDDPADNVFLECAPAAQDDSVVSGDRYLQKVKNRPMFLLTAWIGAFLLTP